MPRLRYPEGFGKRLYMIVIWGFDRSDGACGCPRGSSGQGEDHTGNPTNPKSTIRIVHAYDVH